WNAGDERLLQCPPLCFDERSGLTVPATAFPVDSARFVHEVVPFLSAYSEGESEGGGDCVAPADAARGHAAAGGCRNLCVATARLSGVEENRADRSRGTGSRRRARIVDAHIAACRSLARERALRRVWTGNAPHQRSPQARTAVRANQ